MNIAAMTGAGAVYNPTAVTRNLSTGVYRTKLAPENPSDATLPQTQAASEVPGTASTLQAASNPAADVFRTQEAGTVAAQTQAVAPAYAAPTAAPATHFASSATAGAAMAGAAATTTGSLMTDLQSYANAARGGESQAYQEYAKAWGGRVVHGAVELPPLSVYSE